MFIAHNWRRDSFKVAGLGGGSADGCTAAWRNTPLCCRHCGWRMAGRTAGASCMRVSAQWCPWMRVSVQCMLWSLAGRAAWAAKQGCSVRPSTAASWPLPSPPSSGPRADPAARGDPQAAHARQLAAAGHRQRARDNGAGLAGGRGQRLLLRRLVTRARRGEAAQRPWPHGCRQTHSVAYSWCLPAHCAGMNNVGLLVIADAWARAFGGRRARCDGAGGGGGGGGGQGMGRVRQPCIPTHSRALARTCAVLGGGDRPAARPS